MSSFSVAPSDLARAADQIKAEATTIREVRGQLGAATGGLAGAVGLEPAVSMAMAAAEAWSRGIGMLADDVGAAAETTAAVSIIYRLVDLFAMPGPNQ